MKNLVATASCLVLLCFFFAQSAQSQSDPACDGTGAIHGIYYMSCFPRGMGETTDNPRIQRAIDSIPSGKLIFNEGLYTVNDTITLDAGDSFLILEGTSTSTTNSPNDSSNIRMTATNKPIFKIGEAVYEVTIRDLALTASSKTGTVGILAQGAVTASAHFEFRNLRFSGFEYGIQVEPLAAGPSWQFDNVKLDHCFFENNSTGVYVNSLNSGWQISSLEFTLFSGQIGLDLAKITYSQIDSMIGNGVAPTPPAPAPYALIRIKEHASISISNCVSEGVEYDVLVEGVSLEYPIFLYNNSFLDKVDISAATVYATSNQYGIVVPPNFIGPQPVARNGSNIYSYGEKFCFEGSTACPTSGWQFMTDAYMVSSSNQFKNFWSRPSLFENVVEINTNAPMDPLDKPLFSVIAPTYGGKALLRLGQANDHYTLSRNATTGWLDFQGNQAPPNRGYNFNGPVKLPSFAQSALPAILENGSMVFCSNCSANTTPCASGGSGALAISISSQWVCK